jgi:thiol-disulfide isomerase/thioredoxin
MKQSQDTKPFWTTARLSAAAFVFTLAALVISSCTSNDTANLTANNNAAQPNQPKVTITTSRGTQPAQPSDKTQAPPAPQQQAQLQTIPPEVWNTSIQAVDGGTFRLSDYKDKVVVLDLWATWCGPCRAEIPHLVDLNKEYGDKGVQIIGLTTENPQTDADAVRTFAQEMNINYKLGWARGDMAVALMNGRPSIPQTFVIGPGGNILFHQIGYSSNLPERIRDYIGRAGNKTSGD